MTAAVAANEYGRGNADDERSFAADPSSALRGAVIGGGGRSGVPAPGGDACRARGRGAGVVDGGGGDGLFLFGEGGVVCAGSGGGGGIRGAETGSEQSISAGGGGGAAPAPPPPAVAGRRLAGEASAEQDLDRRGRRPAVEREGGDPVEGGRDLCRQGGATALGLLASSSREGERAAEEKRAEGRLLAAVRALLRELEGDLDAARVLLPECHRFRQVVGCVAEAVGPGMVGARPRQAMDLTEALREATQFSRTLSSPEAFLVVMAELLADGFEVRTLREKPPPVVFCCVMLCFRFCWFSGWSILLFLSFLSTGCKSSGFCLNFVFFFFFSFFRTLNFCLFFYCRVTVCRGDFFACRNLLVPWSYA